MKKLCSACGLHKEVSEFHKQSDSADGLKYYCKPCSKEYSQKRRLNNLEKCKEQERKYAKSLQGKYSRLKKVARKDNKICNISFQEYCEMVSKPCEYCLGYFGELNDADFGYFIDRKDTHLGYEITNCCACCTFCNRVKMHQLTYDETKAAIQAIISVREKATLKNLV
jgi:hypothetical protein